MEKWIAKMTLVLALTAPIAAAADADGAREHCGPAAAAWSGGDFLPTLSDGSMPGDAEARASGALHGEACGHCSARTTVAAASPETTLSDGSAPGDAAARAQLVGGAGATCGACVAASTDDGAAPTFSDGSAPGDLAGRALAMPCPPTASSHG